jgi:hypothetical protein
MTRYCDHGCGYKLPDDYTPTETTCGACLNHIEFVTTYLVTFTADTPVRSITFAATTTDPADAKSLAYDNLIELIGHNEARNYKHHNTQEENPE